VPGNPQPTRERAGESEGIRVVPKTYTFPIFSARLPEIEFSRNNPSSPNGAQLRLLTYFQLLPCPFEPLQYLVHCAGARVQSRYYSSHSGNQVPLPEFALRDRGLPASRLIQFRRIPAMLLWRRNEEGLFRASISCDAQEGGSQCIHALASFPLAVPHFSCRPRSASQSRSAHHFLQI